MRARLRSIVLTLGILAFAALGMGFLIFAKNLDAEESNPSRHADGMVVLTGGAERVSDAVDLFAAGHADKLLITGVNTSTTREGLARRLPHASNLIHCCVELGYTALNTSGNARETADWVRQNNMRSVIVVTSNYHMPRALAEIAALLPDTDLQPYPVVSEESKGQSWWSNARRVRLIALEYLKYVAVLARQSLVAEAPPERGGTRMADAPR